MIAAFLLTLSLGFLVVCVLSIRAAKLGPRPWLWSALAAVLALGALGSGALGALALLRPWTPMFDDGPFHGVPRAEAPTHAPNQSLPLDDDLTLDVFDRQAADIGPTVRLRRGGDTLWTVYAVADGTKSEVTSIRFADSLSLPLGDTRVRGQVVWTYGHEATWWFIARDGALNGYWFSW